MTATAPRTLCCASPDPPSGLAARRRLAALLRRRPWQASMACLGAGLVLAESARRARARRRRADRSLAELAAGALPRPSPERWCWQAASSATRASPHSTASPTASATANICPCGPTSRPPARRGPLARPRRSRSRPGGFRGAHLLARAARGCSPRCCSRSGALTGQSAAASASCSRPAAPRAAGHSRDPAFRLRRISGPAWPSRPSLLLDRVRATGRGGGGLPGALGRLRACATRPATAHEPRSRGAHARDGAVGEDGQIADATRDGLARRRPGAPAGGERFRT